MRREMLLCSQRRIVYGDVRAKARGVGVPCRAKNHSGKVRHPLRPARTSTGASTPRVLNGVSHCLTLGVAGGYPALGRFKPLAEDTNVGYRDPLFLIDGAQPIGTVATWVGSGVS